MLLNNSYKENDLELNHIQYQISWLGTSNFKCREKVFLKSNPEFPLTVVKVGLESVFVRSERKNKKGELFAFPPECILQYKYAALIEYYRKYNLCLN